MSRGNSSLCERHQREVVRCSKKALKLGTPEVFSLYQAHAHLESLEIDVAHRLGQGSDARKYVSCFEFELAVDFISL